MDQQAYQWLAELLQRQQRPELVLQGQQHQIPNQQFQFMGQYPTSNWVAPEIGQTPLGVMPGPGQAMRKIRGF